MSIGWKMKKASWRLRHAIYGDGETQSPDGCTYRCTSWLDRMRAKTRMGESTVIERLRDECRQDDIVWDIGANIGIVACPVLRELRSGQVVAFEPLPHNANRLEINLSLNSPDDRWQVHQLCLGATETTVEFPVYDETIGAGGQSQVTSGDPIRTIEVPEQTGDDLIASGEVPHPDILKIDVEGAEWDVIRGMESALSSVRFAVIEVHPNRLSVPPFRIHDAVTDAGFDITKAGDRGSEYHMFATRHD